MVVLMVGLAAVVGSDISIFGRNTTTMMIIMMSIIIMFLLVVVVIMIVIISIMKPKPLNLSQRHHHLHGTGHHGQSHHRQHYQHYSYEVPGKDMLGFRASGQRVLDSRSELNG